MQLIRHTFDAHREWRGLVGATYRLSPSNDGDAPWLKEVLEVPLSRGTATLSRHSDTPVLTLIIDADWAIDDSDSEAGRIAAVLALMLRGDVRVARIDPKPGPEEASHSAPTVLRIVTNASIAQERDSATRLIASSDPRGLPGWTTYVLALGTRDRIARFVLLWAVLDLLVQGETVAQVDAFLTASPYCLPRDFPDKYGNKNRETFPTFCRQRLAHAHGRRRHWDHGVLVGECGRAAEQLESVLNAELVRRLGGV